MITAYVDESLRRRPHDDGVYAMAAVVVDSADHDGVREALEALRFGRSLRLHWRDESHARRLAITKALTTLPVTGIVTVHLHRIGVRHERARRLCLERLLYEIGVKNAATVTVESRSAEDHFDRSLLTGLRRSRRVSLDMYVCWASPFEEPLLWAADAVAGATTWWLDGQPQYFDLLTGQFEAVCVE